MKTNFLLLTLLGLAACSAKVDGGSPAQPTLPNGGFMDEKATIPGPTLEGHWLSKCNSDGYNKFRIWEITVQGGSLTRQESTFNDSACQQSAKVEKSQGRFRFIDKYSDGSYNIEYAFVNGNITVFPQEKVKLDGTTLYISDRRTGEAAGLLTKEPLYKNGVAPQPAPTPVPPAEPSETTAVIADNYGSVRYAFCSTQGLGILIDFQATPLNTDGQGTARVGSKVCGDGRRIRWQARQVDFTVKMSSGRPTISFLGSTYDDRISTSSYQNGLRGSQAANTVIGGNSGECFFLENAATKGLPFIYDCN